MEYRLLALIVLSLTCLVQLQVFADTSLIEASPIVKVLVYPDGSIRLVYSLVGDTSIPLNVSRGAIDYSLTYTRIRDRLVITLAGGLEASIGEPSGKPVKHSILFIGFTLSSKPLSGEKGFHSTGMAIINIDEYYNNTTSHVTVNVSRIIANTTPIGVDASFSIEVRGLANTSMLSSILWRNLSEINAFLAERGYNWIRMLEYNVGMENNTYKINGRLFLNFSQIINVVAGNSLGGTSRFRECLDYLFDNISVNIRLAQALWSEEYHNASRTGAKTDFTLEARGDIDEYISRIEACLPEYMKLLSITGVNLTSLTIPGIDFKKYLEIPSLVPIDPHGSKLHLRASLSTSGVEFNLTVDSGRLLYNNTNLPPETRAQKAIEIVKDYLENLTALLEPYRITLGLDHIIPLNISLQGIENQKQQVIVEPETITLFKPVKIIVRIEEKPETTTQPQQTTTVTITKTITETITETTKQSTTETTTMISTTTTTKTIAETITTTITLVDVKTLLTTLTISVATAIIATYILVTRKKGK